MANQLGAGGGGGPSPPKKLKSPSSQGAQQTLFVLEATEERTNPQGTTYGVTNVLASTTQFSKRHELYVAEKHVRKIQESKHKTLLVKGFTLREDSSIRISESSIVMNTAMTSAVTDQVVKYHTAPAVQDIATIKSKEKGERASLKGTVDKITNILQTPTSKRRIVTIRDDTGDIEVKLWSDKVSLISTAGHEVEITCVTVDHYMSRVSLNSNISTAVKIVDTEDTIEGRVVAACFEEDEMSLLIGDHLLNVTSTIMGRIFPLMQFVDNVYVKGKRSGNTLTEITEVHGNEEVE